MIEIIKRKMAGGQLHEHIAEVQYINEAKAVKKVTRAGMVKWLDESDVHQAIVRSREDPSKFAYVGTVHPEFADPYIRTHANGKWTDNLLALDEY